MKRTRIPTLLWLACLAALLGAAAPVLLSASQGSYTNYLPVVIVPGEPPPENTLVNGGSVTGPGGVGVGALADTLAAPVEISIETAPAPALPLPAHVQLQGGFYRIAAGENVFAAAESPFILAFPAPAGAAKERLALAALLQSAWLNDAEEGLEAWVFLEGQFDEQADRFLSTAAGLLAEGTVFALVEHPDFERPPSTAEAGEVLHSADPANGGAHSEAMQTDAVRAALFNRFQVRCVDFLTPTDCTAAEERAVASQLNVLYERIHQHFGLKEPRLRYLSESLTYNPHSLAVLGYTAYIEPQDTPFCHDSAGYYDPVLGRLVYCLNPALGMWPDSEQILAHEYFHATQYAYPQVLIDFAGSLREKWVIEGMASSVENAFPVEEMLRSTRYGGLHEVDISMGSYGGNSLEYRAQDFWVYYGQRHGLDLSYLESVLERGATSRAVTQALGDGQRLNEYWLWAKNHFMEPVVDYGGLLGNMCEPNFQVVDDMQEFTFEHAPNGMHTITVDPLSSVAVRMKFDNAYRTATAEVSVGPNQLPEADLALRYKFYWAGDRFCTTVPDRQRVFAPLVPQEMQIYALVSNIDPYNSYRYEVRIISYALFD